ncbi:FAD/NAD(P)-binding protein [Streptomyces sp. NPDC005374]|uniref:FAD/NAD(P)-binding protein n=1 Tax=Streptomyces sp. NPDC005374 TaxID=3364713 RepID=UPI0036BCD1A2
MTRNSPVHRVAVVGAGAAGALTTVHLLNRAAEHGVALDMTLIDPSRRSGPGLAYGTRERHHLLNVPASRMSALPDDAGHFVRWLTARRPSAVPEDFVPRRDYGQYLAEVLEHAARTSRSGRPRRLHAKVVGVHREAREMTLTQADGARLRADAAVLALGNPVPAAQWAGDELRSSPRFVADPWAPGALDTVEDTGDVLLVGTGLTMADVAVTLAGPGRVLHAVSRHGLVPHPHLAPPAPPAAPCPLDGALGLDVLRRDIRRHLSACRREHGDWRPGMDGLRPLTADLWQQLTEEDRTRFLQEDLRSWEVHRHRLAPPTAARLHALRGRGRLRVAAAEIVGAAVDRAAVRVRLSDGRQLQVTAVVNCTGARTDLHRAGDPLVDCLLRDGTARPGPAGQGLDTAGDGRLVPATGPAAPLWTIGAVRRGNLLETTAIPEIRGQAAQVADSILNSLAPRTGSTSAGRGVVPVTSST